MDESIIIDIADALRGQYKFIERAPVERAQYRAQLRDDTIEMARVICKHNPEYDIDLFYKRAGYSGTHPTVH